MSFVIGDYTALRQLAVSETSSVWSGRHSQTGREVALKIMSVLSCEQIRREAALAGLIEHPHLVSAYDVAVSDDWCALVMQPANRGSLAGLLTAGALTAGQTITVLAAVGAALAVAHERGLTHGDLSPGNVLLDDSGKPMLSDLGAARAAAEVNVQVSATPGYVAPEVARGSLPNAASDVFSLGAVALHCLTGKAAWPADDLRDVVIQATAGQWPDPGSGTDATPALLEIVRAMLSSDPLTRPGATTMLLDLPAAGLPAPLAGPVPSAHPRGLGRHACENQSGGADSAPVPGHGAAESDAGEYVMDRSGLAAWVESTDVGMGDPDSDGPTFATSGTRSEARTQLRMRSPVLPPPPSARPGLLGFFADRHKLIRYVVIPVALSILLSAAVFGGLWWARSSENQPMAVSGSDSMTAETGRTSTMSVDVGMDSGVMDSGGMASGGMESGGRASGGMDQTESAETMRWRAVITELDRVRSAAFAARDVQALQQVYQADSEALRTDVDRILSLQSQGLRVDGVEHDILQVSKLDQPGIVIEVTDSMPAGLIRDDSGAVVGRTADRGARTRTVVLVEMDAGFRIVSMSTV